MTEMKGEGPENNGLVVCALCRHFSYFKNVKNHNTPHALGRCLAKSWDGEKGQWAMFQHHCRNFAESDPEERRGRVSSNP